MPSRNIIFQTGGYYHIYNRGVEKRAIFTDEREFNHFLTSLVYYQQSKAISRFSVSDFDLKDRELPSKIDIVTYALMPNHFHFLVKQIHDDGIKSCFQPLLTSYSKYFNIKNDRVGPLFQGRFKAVEVMSDDQLLQTSRYIFLNPHTAGIVDKLSEYKWSAFNEYFDKKIYKICNQALLEGYFSSDYKSRLRKFILDFEDYSRSKNNIKID